PDGEYPVINGEKGIVNLGFRRQIVQTGAVQLCALSGGEAANVVPAAAKATLECPAALAQQLVQRSTAQLSVIAIDGGVQINATGVSAHGSTPAQGENAIGRLLCALAALPLSADVLQTVQFLAEKLGTESDGTALGIAASDAVSGALTLNLGVISGNKTGLCVQLNLRYPVTGSYEASVPPLQKAFANAGFTPTQLVHKAGFYFAPEHKLVAALCAVYTRETGLPAVPKCIGGGTYAKVIPNIVAFGPIFPGDEIREHKPDEFIEQKQLVKNAQIIAAAMRALANDRT
ncbi:MAG: Sapep family Mn(2+)-dependent dipeptidase, partial [Pygmaiobacter sp.]